MTSPLKFRCTGCGNCCRSLRVVLTSLDLRRLVDATGHPARELVTWLAPDAVDMSGEPDGFVELSEGRRLMVLAQRAGACVLLDADDRCRAYSARPRDCRAFPFDFEGAGAGAPALAARQLRLLPLADCHFADDGENDGTALATEDAERWRELASYHRLVARWNRRAFHRRRLMRAVGSADDFLGFALSSC